MSLKRIGELCPICDAPLLLDEPANVVFCQNPKCGYTYNLGDDPEEEDKKLAELDKKIAEMVNEMWASFYTHPRKFKLLTLDTDLREEFGLDN